MLFNKEWWSVSIFTALAVFAMALFFSHYTFSHGVPGDGCWGLWHAPGSKCALEQRQACQSGRLRGCHLHHNPRRETEIAWLGFPGSADDDINAGDGSNLTCNPINISTGNKFFQFADYQDSNFAFSHYYNSITGSWRFSYQQRLMINDDNFVIAKRVDGKGIYFIYDSGVYHSSTNRREKLIFDGEFYQLILSNNVVETYDATGRLLSIASPNNQIITLSYTGLEITLTKGSTQLIFVLGGSNELIQATFPNGSSIVYSYQMVSGNPLLVAATKSEGGVQRYLYEDARYPTFITGIIDEQDNRISSVQYDDQGRAISSEKGLLNSGVERTQIEYHDDGTRTVTNALGKQNTYHFTQFNGEYKITQVEGHPSTNCTGANKNYTYDANGFLSSKTDWKGNITAYTHNDLGQELSRTEALNTIQRRSILTEWHIEFNKPIKITTDYTITEFIYNSEGQLLSKTSLPNNGSVPIANSGNDSFTGGSGADNISGGDGDDTLHGEGGADTLQGDSGNDILYGGEGSDVLLGGTGEDALWGGAGIDTYVVNLNEGKDWVHGQRSEDILIFGAGIAASDIFVERYFDNIDLIIIQNNIEMGRVVLVNQLSEAANDVNGVFAVHFADGTVWGVEHLRSRAILAGSWMLNEQNGNVAFDGSGQQSHGSHLNGFSTIASPFAEPASRFDGINQYISIPRTPTLSATNFTLEAWVKPDTTSGWRGILMRDSTGPGAWPAYSLKITTFNQFEIAIKSQNGTFNYIGSITKPRAGQWYHVAATYDGSWMRLYINGVEESQYYYTGGVNNEIGPIVVGAGFYNRQVADFFDGSLSRVTVRREASTETEILSRYQLGLSADLDNDGMPNLWEQRYSLNATDPNDAAENTDGDSLSNLEEYQSGTHPHLANTGYEGTVVTESLQSYWPMDVSLGETFIEDKTQSGYSAAITNGFAPGTGINGEGSIVFNGNNEYLSVDSPPVLVGQAYSLALWVKPDTASGWRYLLVRDSNAAGPDPAYLLKITDYNRIQFAMKRDTGLFYAIDSTTVPSANAWYFVVATYDGNTMKLYINGQLESQRQYQYGINNPIGPLLIGAGYFNNMLVDYFPGSLDNVAIYQEELSAEHILDQYQAGFGNQ